MGSTAALTECPGGISGLTTNRAHGQLETTRDAPSVTKG